MTLHCEMDDAEKVEEATSAAIIDSIRELTKLRGEVRLVARGSLPADGKVIDDIRDYT
jgi:phenylacetate-CoA ligase